MRFVPIAISRKIAGQVLLAQKHSPTILFGVGVTSLVGSTVLACRATLKVEGVLAEIEKNKRVTERAKEKVDSGTLPDHITYTDDEVKQDMTVIVIRGALKVVKLYAPAAILGGIGLVCLTKSHRILQDRNAALTAAYVALDAAFRTYRERVVDRYGEETDRDLRYDYEEVSVIDEETGKVSEMYQITPGDKSGYARWFDETNSNWHAPPHDNYNWIFLRSNQNWANDMLRSRGHLFLNEVYKLLGMPHTSAGAIVGWVYDRNNENGDNYVDFGCWDNDTSPMEFFNGRDGSILCDFNVDGPIWQLIDERNARDTAR